MYFLHLQRSLSRLAYLRYNILQLHRCHNLPNIVRHQVPEIVLATGLKHVITVAGLSSAAHNRLRRFQAEGFSNPLATTIVPAPPVIIVKLLFVCCPAFWWNYLGS
jgi:hypothetical protein